MSRTRFFLPAVFLIFASLAALGGCTHVYTANGAYYRVQKNDTIEGIAKKHRITEEELIEINNIAEGKVIPGENLYIPGASPSTFAAILKREGIVLDKKQRKVASSKKRQDAEPKIKKDKKDKKDGKGKKSEPDTENATDAPEADDGPKLSKSNRTQFSWPIDGEISSLYGMRHGRRHDGVDIRAKIGTAIFAADSGEVVYSKKMRGYGNLVLLRHANDFFTVYAHNSVNLVKVGAKVKKGQMVARVGRTGRATGPHLHFEVREGSVARNPLFFLPKSLYAEKALKKGDAVYGSASDETEVENP